MTYNTICANPAGPDSLPVFPRQPGGTPRAFGSFLAFFQSRATGSASADSLACDVTLSQISDLGVRRCILVYFGDLRPLEWVPPRRVTLNSKHPILLSLRPLHLGGSNPGGDVAKASLSCSMFSIPALHHSSTPFLRAASREFVSWQVASPLAHAKNP
jgi:hypothetical protein